MIMPVGFGNALVVFVAPIIKWRMQHTYCAAGIMCKKTAKVCINKRKILMSVVYGLVKMKRAAANKKPFLKQFIPDRRDHKGHIKAADLIGCIYCAAVSKRSCMLSRVTCVRPADKRIRVSALFLNCPKQSFRVIGIVLIAKKNILPACSVKSCIAGRANPAVLLVQHMKPCVLSGGGITDGAAVISAAIVNQKTLPI